MKTTAARSGARTRPACDREPGRVAPGGTAVKNIGQNIRHQMALHQKYWSKYSLAQAVIAKIFSEIFPAAREATRKILPEIFSAGIFDGKNTGRNIFRAIARQRKYILEYFCPEKGAEHTCRRIVPESTCV